MMTLDPLLLPSHNFYQIKDVYMIAVIRDFPPTEQALVHFSGEWIKTASCKSFLLAENCSGIDKIVVFQQTPT